MLTYKLNPKAAAALSAAIATGVLTIATLVYAAGDNDASSAQMASAATRAAAGAAPSELVIAAGEGNVPAMWRLGHMYLSGRGVHRDELQAMDYFRRIADENAEADPLSATGRLVADSFVNLAALHAAGIEGAPKTQDEAFAARLLTHAATYFAAPVAQYRLALMYSEGRGVDRNMRRAVNWLILAARKQHTEAQAVLGRLLVSGGDDGDVPMVRDIGLMWLEIASRYADPSTEAWIAEEHAKAFAATTDAEAAAAIAKADRWLADHAHTN